MRLRLVLAADVANHYSFGDYFSLRLVTSFIGIFVITLIAATGFEKWELTLLIVAVGIAKVLESISDVIYGLFEKEDQANYIGKSLIAKGFLSLVSFGGIIYLTGSVFLAVIVLAMAWGIVLAAYDSLMAKRLLAEVHGTPSSRIVAGERARSQGSSWRSSANMKRLARNAAPLSVVAFLGSLSNNVPRYFIEHFLGDKMLGIYTAMAYIGLAGLMVVTAMGYPVIPRLAKSYQDSRLKEFWNLYKKLLLIAVGMGLMGVLGVILFGPSLLSRLYSPEYAFHAKVFLYLMIVASLNYVVLFQWCALTAMGKFNVQLILSILTLATLSTLCVYLIPRLGIEGAAFAEILGLLPQVLLGHAGVQRACRHTIRDF